MDSSAEWDDEVDVICTDAGFAGLATAIMTVRAGGTVFLASAPAVPGHAAWFTADSPDPDTAVYLNELVADIDVEALPVSDPGLPVRLVRRQVPPKGRRRIATFEGARLREWAMHCIPAPSGYLYTRVTGWETSALETADGQALAVSEVGAMTPDSVDFDGSVLRWLRDQARDSDVTPEPVTSLARLVLEEGMVAGAVFATEEGPLAVRARHGVMLCRATQPVGAPRAMPELPDLRVALVGRLASRFGRVELLTADADVAGEAAAHARASDTVRTADGLKQRT